MIMDNFKFNYKIKKKEKQYLKLTVLNMIVEIPNIKLVYN